MIIDMVVFNCYNISLESFDGVGIVEQITEILINRLYQSRVFQPYIIVVENATFLV